jgi:diadenosine tetraphosphatase ApaH/serine/threonine PP2A family protein phosphatase
MKLSRVLAVLYDIHGNLPALEAVLAEAEGLAGRYLLGGDYGTPSPWPRETLDRLRTLPDATWIRGNGERWIFEPPADRPEVLETYEEFMPGPLSEGELRALYSLPASAEIDGVLYVHGCPRQDDDSFAREPQPEDEARLAGVRDRTVVFGHSHVQFRRDGPSGTRLVNPGSVGMPLDGDVRAAWAVWDGSDFAFRRTEYDVERAAAGWRRLGGDFGTFAAARIERGSD